MGFRKNGKEEDEWRRGEADCGRIRRGKSKNGRSLGAGRREGSRWMASGGGADCGRIRRERCKNEGCCNAVGARGQWMENSDAPGVGGEPGGHRASGRGRDSPDADFFLLMCVKGWVYKGQQGLLGRVRRIRCGLFSSQFAENSRLYGCLEFARTPTSFAHNGRSCVAHICFADPD